MISDIIGMTGRAMPETIIGGEGDTVKLAALPHPHIKSPPKKLGDSPGSFGDGGARVPIADLDRPVKNNAK